jgi:hypothetical protein
VPTQLNVAVEGIKVGGSAAMVGGPSIGSEVFAGNSRILCAPREYTTEVGLEERLQCRHTCANLSRVRYYDFIGALLFTNHRHHGLDGRPNHKVKNCKRKVTISLLKVGDNASETDDADNASGRSHRKHQ